MADVRWRVLTIGYLSRNKFWGESEARPYRAPLCTSTVLQCDGQTILVDPGLPADALARVLDARAGLPLTAVDTVFLTHFHGDHRVGLASLPQARWCMAAPEIAYWEAQLPPDNPDRAILARLAPVAGELAPGLVVLPTPGHTPGHASLSFGSDGLQVVIAGDAVMTGEFFLARDVYFNTVDRAAAIASIDAMAERAAIVVPGHDNYFLNRAVIAGTGTGGSDG